MKYKRDDFSIHSVLTFDDELIVDVNRKTKEWNIRGLRRPTLEDMQAVIGIILEVLSLPLNLEIGDNEQ